MPKKNQESFSQRLIRLRKAKGLTQQELADKSDISRRMIAYFETRVVNLPPQSVVALAKALDVSIDELIGFASSQDKEFIRNRKLIKKVKALDDLPAKDQKDVLKYIDMVLTQHSLRRGKRIPA